jgi:hypothetical protein
MKSNFDLDTLPNEILLKILSFLPQCDLIHSVSVLSKRFHDLSKDRSLRLTTSLYNQGNYIASAPEFLNSRFHQIDSFNIYFTPPEYLKIDSFDSNFIQYFEQMQILVFNLVYNTPLSHNYFFELFKNQLNLKKLALKLKDPTSLNHKSYFQQVDSPFLLASNVITTKVRLLKGISSCQALEHLDLHLKSLSYPELEEVSSLPNLKKLLIHLAPDITPIKLRQVLTGPKWHKIVTLSIYSHHMDDSSFNAVAEKCPSLKHLILKSRYNLLSGPGITTFLTGSAMLETLKIHDFYLPMFSDLSPYFRIWQDLDNWCYRHLCINKYVLFRRTESIDERQRE